MRVILLGNILSADLTSLPAAERKTGGALCGRPRFGSAKNFCRRLSQQVKFGQLDGDIAERCLEGRTVRGDISVIST